VGVLANIYHTYIRRKAKGRRPTMANASSKSYHRKSAGMDSCSKTELSNPSVWSKYQTHLDRIYDCTRSLARSYTDMELLQMANWVSHASNTQRTHCTNGSGNWCPKERKTKICDDLSDGSIEHMEELSLTFLRNGNMLLATANDLSLLCRTSEKVDLDWADAKSARKISE
jgi:hypothetical protein